MNRHLRYTLITLGIAAGLAYPFVANEFWIVQIAIKSLWLGSVAASLTFLVRFGGMVSLAQTAIYGTSGYVVANLTAVHGLNPWAAAIAGVLGGTILAVAIGAIAARSQGIYFLMLTLAVGVFIYYFALQSRTLTGGMGGINSVPIPSIGPLSLRNPVDFYFIALVLAVGVVMALRTYAKSPLGLALEGVRDSSERMQALGFHVSTVRIAAFTFSGLVASAAGVIAVWYNGRISPGSIDLTRTIDVLVVAVIGGITRVEGAWLGAVLITILQNYASDFTARYNTAIGLIFMAVVLLSSSGILGIPRGVARLRLVRRRTDSGLVTVTNPMPLTLKEQEHV